MEPPSKAEEMLLDLMELDMEYKLTIAVRLSDDECSCPQYLVNRKEVLFPEIVKKAEREGKSPADIFNDFQKKVHARFCGS